MQNNQEWTNRRITLREASGLTGLSFQMLTKEIGEYDIVSEKIGRYTTISLGDLARYVETSNKFNGDRERVKKSIASYEPIELPGPAGVNNNRTGKKRMASTSREDKRFFRNSDLQLDSVLEGREWIPISLAAKIIQVSKPAIGYQIKTRSLPIRTLQGRKILMKTEDAIKYAQRVNCGDTREGIVEELIDYMGGRPQEKVEIIPEIRRVNLDARFFRRTQLNWEEASRLLLSLDEVGSLAEAGEILRDTKRYPEINSFGKKVYFYIAMEVGEACQRFVRRKPF